MAIRMDFDGEKAGKAFTANVTRYKERHYRAIQAAARRCASEIERRGRAQMKEAGDFDSSRWQQGFRALVSFRSRSNIRIRVTHAVKFWRIFQKGGVIRGRPLLWIPFKFARDAIGVLARNYPGRLFRVDRKNGKAPLLMADGGRPKYFGKPSVRIPKKFRLIEIARSEQRKLGRYFREAMNNGRR